VHSPTRGSWQGLGLGHGQSNNGSYFWQWNDNGTFKAFLIGPIKKKGFGVFRQLNGLAIAK
jgi:hypothetical protein